MASARTKILLVLTNLVSILCLVWVLRGADLKSLAGEILAVKWPWIAFAVVADLFVYFVQGWRWSLLLQPISRIPVWRSVRAVYVGLFANEILPFRTGEVIRCYLQSRWGNIPISVSLSSALIERIFDGIWLVLYLGVVILFFDLPTAVQRGGMLLMLFIAALVAALGWIVFSKQHARGALAASKWAKTWRTLVDDLHSIADSRSFYFAWLGSLPHLLSMTLPIYGVARAYGLDLTLAEAAVVNVIVRLGTVVPSAPGNLGTYQALVVVSLTMLGVHDAIAKRFSLLLWSVVTVPLLLGGFVALSVTGFKIRELQKKAQHESRTT